MSGLFALGAGVILFVVAIGLATTIFWVVELIDAARREFPDPNMKIIWLLVIFFGHIIGGLIYYFAGKPTGWLPGEGPRERY